VRQSVSRMCCWVRTGSFQAFRGSSPITTSSPSRKHTRSQGPSLRRRYPASSVDPVRLPPCPPPHATLELRAPTETGLPRLLVPPAQRAELTTPTDRAGACVDCFPVRTAFPVIQAGRHPHLHFRGLLKLHSRYGPLDCSTAQRLPLSRRLRPSRLPNRAARQLPDQSTTLWMEPSSTGDTRLRGALNKKG
jgi:hypothetical protein